MFQGILIFGIAGVVVIIAYVAMVSNRRREQDDLPPEDRLSDEEFRRVEYGDALERADLEDHIRGLARTQHRDMVRSLLTGAFDKAARLAGRGSGGGDIPLARDKGRPARKPRGLPSPAANDTVRTTTPPDDDDSIEQLDSAEMKLVDDGPIVERVPGEPIEYHTPLLDPDELAALGFRLIVSPLSGLFSMVKAMRESFALLHQHGSLRGHLDRLVDFEGFAGIVGLDRHFATEQQYRP